MESRVCLRAATACAGCVSNTHKNPEPRIPLGHVRPTTREILTGSVHLKTMTTIELLTAANEANRELDACRRAQDWRGAQVAALELAKLYQRLQAEDASRQVLVDRRSASQWFAMMRRAAV